MKKLTLSLFLVFLSCLMFSSCSPSTVENHDPKNTLSAPPQKHEVEQPLQEGADIVPSDYSLASNWLQVSTVTLPVDVFFVYPTAWARQEGEPYVCPTTHVRMRKKAPQLIKIQASAFETAGNLFAPYYRQLDSAFVLSLPPDQQQHCINGIPKTDILAAFDYYLEYYNNDRPFIRAANSQGTTLVKELLFDYLSKHPERNNQLVAAYVIGYSVTQQELEENPHVKFAEHAGDTGVIISYNIEAPQIDGSNTTVLEGSVAINPLSWTRTQAPAAISENLGCFVPVNGIYTKVDGFADATLDLERGTVICSTVSPDDYIAEGMESLFLRGVYHSQDYSFYYFNLRQNAELRASDYLKKTL